ncbi:MAG: serine/threonine-protein kinase [Planctomycetaceae bacterium]
MNSDSDQPSDPLDESAEPTDDPRLCELLDAYTAAVQHRDPRLLPVIPPDLLAQYPDLDSLFQCVRRLDDFGHLAEVDPVVTEPTATGSAANDDSTSQSRYVPIARRRDLGSSIFQSLPREFGTYTLLEQIGSGGMGVVFRASHNSLQAPVAIKLIRNSEWASLDEVRRFYQEARAAAGLVHPGIVKVHDVGEWDGHHFLAMDLIEGPSFSQQLRDRSLSLEQGVEVLTSITRAVAYLHERGIVHRDLKPSNILLDVSGRPSVTDFGLAKVFSSDSDQTTTGTLIGTPTYMSPEQAWGHPSDVTPLCDLYSLGAILYEVITGQPPFVEENPLDVLLRVKEDDPTPPSRLNRQCPRDLEQICLRCLEKDPRRRYQSADELADDLDRFQRREPLQLPTVRWGHRLRKWARREPGLLSRWLGQGVAAVTLQGNFLLNDVDPQHHWPVMLVLLAWAVVSWIAQKLRHHPSSMGDAIPYIWSAADGLLYTLLILLAASPRTSLLVGYPLLIVAAGLWGRTRLVWFMTVVCLLGFTAFHMASNEPRWPTHYPILVGSIVLLTGSFVAYQVHRLQVLSSYFERRR